MKKKNFLCGLGAKLALAVVALTTVTFTSCEKDDFSIEVIKNPAKVTLSTEVIYFNEEGKPSNVDATITYDGSTNNVIMGTKAEPAINKVVKVKAEYNGLSAEKDVTVQASANSTTTQNITIFLIAPEIQLNIEAVEKEKNEVIKWSAPANGHGISHNGAMWNENPNSYSVKITGTYKKSDNQVVTNFEMKADASSVNATVLGNVINGMAWNKDGEDTYSFTASAYSIFAAWYKKVTAEMVYTIKSSVTNAEVAVVSATKVLSTGINFEEKAHPNHEGHYQEGHGNGQGDSSNAGGGIIFAD